MSLRRPAKDQPQTFEFNSSSLEAAKCLLFQNTPVANNKVL